MTDAPARQAIDAIRTWQKIESPNAFAEVVIGDVAGIIAAFEALEPATFEAEPADFVRVLHALAES